MKTRSIRGEYRKRRQVQEQANRLNAEQKPLDQWSDERLAEVVRGIALMTDTDLLAPDRNRWAGAADILMTAADRIEGERA